MNCLICQELYVLSIALYTRFMNLFPSDGNFFSKITKLNKDHHLSFSESRENGFQSETFHTFYLFTQ